MSKTALIVGASGGIGPEIAKRLYRQNYRLILLDQNESAITLLAEELGGAEVQPADLSNRTMVTALCNAIAQRQTGIDVAVINAGIIDPVNLVDSSTESIDRQIDINLRSAIHIIRACSQHMIQRKTGHIIATVSLGGVVSIKGSSIYSASKFGLRGLLMGLHNELAPHNVKVSGIYPSGVDTDMLRYEARNGGSALNFVSTPLSVEDIGDSFDKALKTGKVEVYPNYADSLSSRLVASFPWLLPKITPLLERMGEKGRTKYLQRIEKMPPEA